METKTIRKSKVPMMCTDIVKKTKEKAEKNESD